MNTLFMNLLILNALNNTVNKEYKPLTNSDLYENKNSYVAVYKDPNYKFNKSSTVNYSKRTGQPRNRGTNH
jgi:hypothetical protein